MRCIVSIFIFIFLICSCNQIQKTADAILKPDARELYAREFADYDLNFQEWKTAFEVSKNDSLAITLPYVENGKFNPDKKFTYSYDVFLQKGEKLYVEVENPHDSLWIFIDVFNKEGLKSVKSSEQGNSNLSVVVEESSHYKIIVQPEIAAQNLFNIKIYVQPSYFFPVANTGNQSIQSFWGAKRDGGGRSHEGVDIFAKRGTPVVAATDGNISFTGERGLGGRQVWLTDPELGNSLYYAHLDSIMVSSGQKVTRGDTLGTVGNTGNAKNSPPHLHFGIYQGYGGPVDPLPFVKLRTIPETGNNFEMIKGTILKNGSELRAGPSTKNMQIASLSKNDSVYILGKSENWLHVSVEDSLKGFIHQSLLR